MNQGHLLARQLGGAGDDRRDLVPLYRAANYPIMYNEEEKIAQSIKAGNTVYFTSVPNYTGNNPIPDSITMKAWTAQGAVVVDTTIPNVP